MAETTADPKDIQLNAVASEQYTGDKDTLIVNGDSLGASGGHAIAAPQQESVPFKQEKKGTARGLKAIIVSSIVFALSITVALIITIYCAPPQVPPHGAVTSDDPRCSQIGVDVMVKKGGNAIDGALATLFCLSVVQPESSGLGGGGYLVTRDHKHKKSTSIIFREKSPETLNIDALQLGQAGATVGVPGALKGYYRAHKELGKVSWKTVVEPSVSLARDGYKVSHAGAAKLERYIDCAGGSALKDVFCKQDGTVYQEGETIKHKVYADFLETVAKKGPDALYTGPHAQEIVDLVTDAGGTMTMDDLAGYGVIIEQPITSAYHGLSVETVGGGASGGVFALMMLTFMDQYETKDINKADVYHYMIEAQKVAYALEAHLGDPELSPNVSSLIDYFTSEKFAKKAFNATDINQAQPQSEYDSLVISLLTGQGANATENNAEGGERSHHTTHVSVIGPSEDHVSITSSLNSNFGSLLMTPSGVILNDVLTDFDVNDTNTPNSPVGGKRPQSHMSPLILYTPDRPCGLRMAVGAAGSRFIPADITSVLVQMQQLGLSLDAAIGSPRTLQAFRAPQVVYQETLEDGIRRDLESKGHTMTSVTDSLEVGVVNVAMKVNETLSAKADPIRGDSKGKTGEIVF